MSAVVGELLAKDPITRAYLEDEEGYALIQDLHVENAADFVRAVNSFIRYVNSVVADPGAYEVIFRIPKSVQPFHLLKPLQKTLVHQKDVAHLFLN